MELLKEQLLKTKKSKGCDCLKKLMLIFITVLMVALTTGCDVNIFVNEDEEVIKLTRLSKKELVDGKCYIKDGTSFYEPYLATRTFTSSYSASDDTRIIWMMEGEESLIPTLYKGEAIVFSTSKSLPEDIKVERFKDIGYTIGLAGFNAVQSGQITQYTANMNNMLLNTDAYNNLSVIEAATLTVAELDGNPVTKNDFTYGGVLADLKKGQSYLLGLYIGSYYNELEIKADARAFVSDSQIVLNEISLTKNGYYSVRATEDMESGYYYLPDIGIFRYINMDKRTAMSQDSIDYNKNLVTRGCKKGRTETSLATKEWVLEEKNESVTFKVSLLEGKGKINSIICTTPDGEEIVFHKHTHTYENAPLGQYTFKINSTAAMESVDVQVDVVYKEEIIPEEELDEVVEEETEEERIPLDEADISETQTED